MSLRASGTTTTRTAARRMSSQGSAEAAPAAARPRPTTAAAMAVRMVRAPPLAVLVTDMHGAGADQMAGDRAGHAAGADIAGAHHRGVQFAGHAAERYVARAGD